jgi:outer membrane protein TolC
MFTPVLCALLGQQAARAGTAAPMDFETFVGRVEQHHPEAAIVHRRLAESDEAPNRAGLLPDPQLSAGRSQPSRQWEASLSQSFPWPGTLAAEERAAAAQAAVSRSDADGATLVRRFAAAELFLRMVRIAKRIEVQRASLDVVAGIKDFAHAKFRQGVGSHLEFLQSHSEGAVLKANLAALETDLRNLKRHAALLLGDPATKGPDDLQLILDWPKSSTTTAGTPGERRDSVRDRLLNEQDVEAARSDAAYRRSLPAFTATAMVMKEEMGEPMYGALAGVSLPLFSTSERRSLSRASTTREARIKDEISWHDRQKELARAQTIDRIAQLETNVKVLRDEIVPPVKEHIEAATAQFGQGKASIGAVIEGRRTLLGLQVTEILAHESLALARLGLEKIEAGMVETELDLPVPQLASPTAAGMGPDMGAASGAAMDTMSTKPRKDMQTKPKRPALPAPEDETGPKSSGMGM